jgi:hypothetical protein
MWETNVSLVFRNYQFLLMIAHIPSQDLLAFRH